MSVSIDVHATKSTFITIMFRPVRNKNCSGNISFMVVTLTFATLFKSFASSNYDTNMGMVEKLLGDRDTLIQDGLSYFNGTTLRDVKRYINETSNNHILLYFI